MNYQSIWPLILVIKALPFTSLQLGDQELSRSIHIVDHDLFKITTRFIILEYLNDEKEKGPSHFSDLSANSFRSEHAKTLEKNRIREDHIAHEGWGMLKRS